jgi:transmembrane sensor
MSKKHAGVEDLLSDESFLSWYFKMDARCIKQWEEWIDADPGHKARAEQAVEFLRSLDFGDNQLTPEQVSQAESILLQKIREAGNRIHHVNIPARTLHSPARRWWVAAASVVLLAAGVYTYRAMVTAAVPELHTQYGEIKQNKLPDGTEVTVNADSKIVFSTGWKDGKDREVWLTGEAFFHVSKTPLKSRFIVHANHFDIIVTGTQFNVVSRQDKANVMLKEGSVILHTKDGENLKMAPGDFVEYRRTVLEKKLVRNDSVLAWKDHKLVFDNTPLRDLIQIIKEHYGVSVTTANEAIGSKAISGILPNDNLDVLLQALEATGDFEIVRQGDTYTIKEHHP